MTSPNIQVQDIFWVPIVGVYSTDTRVCVVLRVAADYIQVIYGQGSRDPSIADEEILPSSTTGRRMGLSKPTYFRITNVHLLKRAAFAGKQRTNVCPSSDFVKLLALAQRGAVGTSSAQPSKAAAAPSATSTPAPTPAATPAKPDSN